MFCVWVCSVSATAMYIHTPKWMYPRDYEFETKWGKHFTNYSNKYLKRLVGHRIRTIKLYFNASAAYEQWTHNSINNWYGGCIHGVWFDWLAGWLHRLLYEHDDWSHCQGEMWDGLQNCYKFGTAELFRILMIRLYVLR